MNKLPKIKVTYTTEFGITTTTVELNDLINVFTKFNVLSLKYVYE